MSREYLDHIFNHLQADIYRYATHKHGCRVVQTALEVFRIDQKVGLLRTLLQTGKLM